LNEKIYCDMKIIIYKSLFKNKKSDLKQCNKSHDALNDVICYLQQGKQLRSDCLIQELSRTMREKHDVSG